MRLFVLALEVDALDWFIQCPTNSFDSLDSIIKAFNDKYGDNKEERHFLNPISYIRKKDNETVEQFKKKYNVL